MKCALLIIGDELLAGRTRDLNGHWLSTYLPNIGVELCQVKTISDDESAITSSLDELYKRVDIVITSGGLGPTKDDITKNVLAKYFAKDLTFNDFSVKFIENLYSKFDREWNTQKNSYHFFPEDFTLVDNLNGYAPGLSYFEDQKLLLSAPGVPREFSSMVENSLKELISKHFKRDDLKSFEYFSIRTKGVPEEVIFRDLCPGLWEKLSAIAKLSSLPHLLGIDLVLYFNSDQREEVIQAATKVISDSPLKDFVWQYGNLELEELIVKEAIEKNLTLGFAESCTGGLSSSKVTDVAGASKVYYGSIVSYANSVKENILGVNPNTLSEYGAVSAQCAKEMAIGAQKSLGCDIAISYTGIAGPGGGSKEKPVGTVGIGWSCALEQGSEIIYHKGSRTDLKNKFSRSGLFKLLELIRRSN
ncbi:nicotinamide-nucleotide amidohydrolase family protein [Halobacteriovorax marinus]|uniref:nicotinamide-nucleotide amidohydrolase family protein n=1 Tax=Halobacteriovorax marinus TaxID=97084 RepID=UPI003A91A5F3